LGEAKIRFLVLRTSKKLILIRCFYLDSARRKAPRFLVLGVPGVVGVTDFERRLMTLWFADLVRSGKSGDDGCAVDVDVKAPVVMHANRLEAHGLRLFPSDQAIA
jgi:hypothetical protein